MDGRISTAVHNALPWRLNEIADDFELVDAWALPAIGTRDQFPSLYETFANLAPPTSEESRASVVLFDVRLRLGRLFGWDDPTATDPLPIPGCNETSLQQRLPPDIPAATQTSFGGRDHFRPVFVLADEAAVEVSNKLLHAILHLGWMEQPDGKFRGQMGVYVKHRSALSVAYMLAIAPFRHLIIYPSLLKRLGKAWDANLGESGFVDGSEGTQ